MPENGAHKHLIVRANTAADHRLAEFNVSNRIDVKKENNGKINICAHPFDELQIADYKR